MRWKRPWKSRKLNPQGHNLLTEQIGGRVDNWNTLIETINNLKMSLKKSGGGE